MSEAKASGRLGHKELVAFVNEKLVKVEPLPSYVISWGWMLKQGEGGLFHGDTFKMRFFVLARVPHSTVLIYYNVVNTRDNMHMDEANIMGYVDLRKVTEVREVSKPVLTEAPPGGGLLSKVRGIFGGSAPPPPTGEAAVPRQVIELVVPGRIYTLCPASVGTPITISTSQAPTLCKARPLYLFGWPFPVPPLNLSEGVGSEADANSSFKSNSISPGVFSSWVAHLKEGMRCEQATHQFPVQVIVDSSQMLPTKVILRTTPVELAIISNEDKDLCYTAAPYNDFITWTLDKKKDEEMTINTRTRSRLQANHERTALIPQRPTREKNFYVFKSSEGKLLKSVIDNHIRELAAKMGVGESGGGGGSSNSSSSSKAGGDDDDDDEPDASSKKSASAAAPAAKASTPSKAKAKKADDDDEEEEKPKKKAAKDDDDEEAKPKKKATKADDDEEEKPKKAAKGDDEEDPKKATTKKAEEEEEAKEEAEEKEAVKHAFAAPVEKEEAASSASSSEAEAKPAAEAEAKPAAEAEAKPAAEAESAAAPSGESAAAEKKEEAASS